MMKKKFIALSIALVSATSCSLFGEKVWSWEVSTGNNDHINYCLLIGQLDHDDSMQRTRGEREALDTRPEPKYRKKNYNMEDPKIGHLYFGGPEYATDVPEKKFEIHELEHMEQKSFSGSCWDPITANATAGTWISKHGKNITMFVSNNDGMSEGAIKAHNWYKGMPIFGYDANMSALKLVLADRIMGTIDSTTYGQCLATALLTRNILEASKKDASGKSRIQRIYNGEEGFANKAPKKGTEYDPTLEGFRIVDEEGKVEPTDPISYGKGYMQSPVRVDRTINAVLLQNRALTAKAVTEKGYKGFTSTSVLDFFKEDKKTPLSYPEIFYKFEGQKQEGWKDPIEIDKPLERVNVWQSWGICSDPYFTSNMNLHFDVVFGNKGTESYDEYAKLNPEANGMFNFNQLKADGHGADEKELLDMLDSALSRTGNDRPKAFLINVIRQPNSLQYITKIADRWGIPAKENWIDRSDIPVIFWNRQPSDADGQQSPDIMKNKYFKYTYYVGFDAKQGGDLQGNLITNWLNEKYISEYRKEHKK